MLDQIISFKDLFYCLTQYLSYEEFVNLSSVQKSFYQTIKTYKKEEIF